MNRHSNSIRPPVKWFGGKYYLAPKIASFFPDHQTYVEPFGGAASVLLNKNPAQVEIYNDLDGRVVRLFRVIRDHGVELARRLALTPYSQSEFEECLSEPNPDADEIECARRDYVRWRQSLAGQGKAFSYTLHRSRKGMADVVSAYLSSIDEDLPIIAERIRTVQILNRPAVEVIEKWDSDKTLIYCDPPYVHSTRNRRSLNVYGTEMNDESHLVFAQLLSRCISKIILSGYDNDIYNDVLSDWRKVSFEVPNHSSLKSTKNKQLECLWMNWMESESEGLFAGGSAS